MPSASSGSTTQSSLKMDTPVNSSSTSVLDALQNLRACKTIFMAFITCTLLVLLPLFVSVLFVGFQRWRKRRSNPTAETITHSDVITFNVVTLEFVALLGMCLFCYGFFAKRLIVLIIGRYILSCITPGQTLFHVLTCVERYLAVVHPVTYMGLRQSGGVRIRNISIGCVWVICSALIFLAGNVWITFVVNFLILLASSAVVCFCSLAVLCVLIRPAQREVGGNRERVDPRRHRAFHTIVVITGFLLVRLLGLSVYALLNIVSVINRRVDCLMSWSTAWLSLPSSLLLPLLFLHRAGKLRGCKQSTAAG